MLCVTFNGRVIFSTDINTRYFETLVRSFGLITSKQERRVTEPGVTVRYAGKSRIFQRFLSVRSASCY